MATIERNYRVTLVFPQTITFDEAGLEMHLREGSEPFRKLLAKNMVEDWGCFNLGEEAEDIVRRLIAHVTQIDTTEVD
jgi:hypothetical protein